MTAPGVEIPPQPGWWARTELVGTSASEYGWAAGSVTGQVQFQGTTSSTYGWASFVFGGTQSNHYPAIFPFNLGSSAGATGTLPFTLPAQLGGASGGSFTPGLPLPANWTAGETPTADAENNRETVINSLGSAAIVIPKRVNVSAATTLTLTTSYNAYVYTGSTTSTWTLPAATGNIGAPILLLHNRGSATVTVQRAGADQIYSGPTLVTSFPLPAGTVARLTSDGTYWLRS